MVQPLLIYGYEQLIPFIPPARRAEIEARVTSHIESETVKTSWSVILVVLGVVGVVAGFFLILAAHEVLPPGVNAFSELGQTGQIISYCLTGISFIVAAIFAQPAYRVLRHNLSITIPEAELPQRAQRERRVYERGFLKSNLPILLQEGELVVIDDPVNKDIECLCYDDGGYGTNYRNRTVEKVVEEWQNMCPSAKNCKPVALETLQGRLGSLRR